VPDTTPFDRKYSLLLKEWEQCEGSIGRYDTIVFAIRGWAVSIFTAVLTASAALNEPKFIVLSIFPTLLFWMSEAINKGFQQLYISRVRAIEDYLVSSQFKDEEQAGVINFATPRISSEFRKDAAKKRKASFDSIIQNALWDNVMIIYVSLLVSCLPCWVLLKYHQDSNRKREQFNKRHSTLNVSS
jgi:hypothetical protein